LRLEHTLRDGIRPPITGIRSIPVPLANGSFAIVMRIPKSWNPPHQVTYQNAFRFYARGSNGKYQIDVNEMRSIFSISSTVADRLRNFRIERTAKIASGDTPVTLLSGGVLVIHVAPFSAFGVGATFPLQEAAQSAAGFPTMGDGYTRRPQVTFDGLLVTSNSEAPPKPQRAYTQVLRSGVVEAVASSLARGQGHEWLILPYLTAYITAHVPLYIASLHSLGVEPPMAVFASLLNVNGMRLVSDPSGNGFLVDMPSTRLTVDQFHFVEAILEVVPRNVGECAKLLRVTLDHLANAAGLDSSPYFDDDGNYTLRH
jgi:hypothetical protein